MSAFPLYSGYVQGAVYTKAGKDYNYTKTTLLNYLTPAYGGWRGGIRWKAGLEAAVDPRNRTTFLEAERTPASTGSYNKTSIALPTTTEEDFLATYSNLATTGVSGLVVTSTANNPFLEFEMPYQKGVRFTPAKTVNYTVAGGEEMPDFMRMQYMTNTNSTDNQILRLYTSVGEDFSLFFYLGPPRYYVGVALP
jgi:hypothetical protein